MVSPAQLGLWDLGLGLTLGNKLLGLRFEVLLRILGFVTDLRFSACSQGRNQGSALPTASACHTRVEGQPPGPLRLKTAPACCPWCGTQRSHKQKPHKWAVSLVGRVRGVAWFRKSHHDAYTPYIERVRGISRETQLHTHTGLCCWVLSMFIQLVCALGDRHRDPCTGRSRSDRSA